MQPVGGDRTIDAVLTETQTHEVSEVTVPVSTIDPFLSVPFPGLDCRGWLVWDPSNRNEETFIA